MPWWDNEPDAAFNQRAGQDFFQRFQQQGKPQLEQTIQTSEEEEDAKGIRGFLGDVVGAPVSGLGKGITEAVGAGIEGLEWYDQNVVANIWDNGLGQGLALASGRDYSDDWKYNNLSGFQRFAAGMLADPTTYLGVSSIGATALKGSALATRSVAISRGLGAASKTARAADMALDYPFRKALQGAVAAGKPIGRGVKEAVGKSDFLTDTFRTLGRPSNDYLRRNSGTQVRQVSEALLRRRAGSNTIPYTGAQASEILKDSVNEVDAWIRAGRPNTGDVPDTLSQTLHTYISGSGGTRLDYRGITKRRWEHARRFLSGTSKRTPASQDIERVDNIIDVVRSSFRDDAYDEGTVLNAAALLSTHAGNDKLSQEIILGTADTKTLDNLKEWITDSATGLRDKELANPWWAPSDSTINTGGWSQAVNDLGSAVEKQVTRDLHKGQELARRVMHNVNILPGHGSNTGEFANWFDPHYQRFWVNGFDKNVVAPFTHLVLGFAFFPVSNVMEEAFQGLVGSRSSTTPWAINFTEFMNSWDVLAETHQLPLSITQGIRRGERSAAAFGEEAISSRAIALQSGRTSKGGLFTDEGLVSYIFGGKALQKSNTWSADMRRGYLLNRFNDLIEDGFPDLVDLSDPNWDALRKANFADRIKMQMNFGIAAVAEGADPDEVVTRITRSLTDTEQEYKRIDRLVDAFNTHPRAKEYLSNNVDGLLSPDSRSDVIGKAFDLARDDTALQLDTVHLKISDWADDALEMVKEVDDPDSYLQALSQLDDARKVMDRLHGRNAEMGSQIATEEGLKASHRWNADKLKEFKNSYRRFNKQANEIVNESIDRLKASGSLSDTGIKELDEMSALYAKRSKLFTAEAEELRQVDRDILPSKGLFRADVAVRNQYFDAQKAIRQKYRGKIDEVEAAIPTMKEEWFEAGVEKQLRSARDQLEGVDLQTRQAAIAGLEDPSELSDDFTRLWDDVEVDAARTAQDSGASVSDARAELWEMKTIEDAMASTETQNEFLGDVDSIFRGTDVDNVPWETVIPEYQNMEKEWKEFYLGLNVVDNVPVVADDVVKATEELTQNYAQALKQLDTNKAKQLSKTAWQDSLDNYHKFFTNYDDGRTFHTVMRTAFPFWRYNYQRWPRLATLVKKHPWVLTNQYRMIQANRDGDIRIPGTGFRINPSGGTYLNSLRNIMKDGGFYWQGYGNPLRQGVDLAQRMGFSPGPSITAVEAAVDPAKANRRIGEEIPTAISILTDTATGVGAQIPGNIGKGFSDVGESFREVFPSRFQDFGTNSVLADRGIHPYLATAEETKSAAEHYARSSLLRGFTGNMASRATEGTRQMEDDQIKLAGENGVPQDKIDLAVRKGEDPTRAQDDDGKFYINVATRRQLAAAHPEWERLIALRSSFKKPDEAQLRKERFRSLNSIKLLEDSVQTRLAPIYAAFDRGEVSGEQFRDARKSELDKIRGARETHDLNFPRATRPQDERDQRVDILAQDYWAIEAPTLDTGLPDWDTLNNQRASFLVQNKTTADETKYITETWLRKRFEDDPLMARTEVELKEAQDLMGEYQDLPKYPGLSEQEQELAEQGLQLMDQIRQSNPQYTTSQALTILARQDPSMAQAVRRALTVQSRLRANPNLNERSKFWKSNPLLDKYYGR